jgi:arginase
VDYRHPGGSTWQEAAQILGRLLASDRARGLEVTIFNPRLDPGGGIAQRLSDLITNSIPRQGRATTMSPQPGAPGE